jgi:hypothetical protein
MGHKWCRKSEKVPEVLKVIHGVFMFTSNLLYCRNTILRIEESMQEELNYKTTWNI